MWNVVTLQSEMEYRHQQLIQEAEDYRRVSRAATALPRRRRTVRLPRLRARTVQSRRAA